MIVNIHKICYNIRINKFYFFPIPVMANRQTTYVVGALGVLVGMVIGATSAQNAQIVSFSAPNPNSPLVRNARTWRRVGAIPRERSEEEALRTDIRAVRIVRGTAPRRSSVSVNVARRLQRRLGDSTLFGSAPVRTVRGVPALTPFWDEECGSITTKRGQTCNYYRQQGFDYIQNYYPITY